MLFIFFNTVYFGKYIYLTIIEEHSGSTHQIHHIVLEKNSRYCDTDIFAFVSSYMKQMRAHNLV